MIDDARPPVIALEDSDEDFEVVCEAMRAAGLLRRIQRAVTGEECLALLRAAPIRPAFVLLDLNVPGLDGRGTLQEIKASLKLHDVPVVVLSTSSNPADLAFCYAAGANAYHVKPFLYEEHLDLLLTLLRYWLGAVVPQDSNGWVS